MRAKIWKAGKVPISGPMPNQWSAARSMCALVLACCLSASTLGQTSQASTASAAGKPKTPGVATSPASSASSGSTEPAQQPSPTGRHFAFADGTVRLPIDKSQAFAVLTASQLERDDLKAQMTVADFVTPDQQSVQVTFDMERAVELQSTGGGTRNWVIPVSVSGLTPNQALGRYATVSLGEKSTVIGYALTNRPASPVDFTLAIKPVWNANGDQSALDITVQTHDQPVTNLQIAQSTLSEQAVGIQIGAAKLHLCTQATGRCDPPGAIPPLANRTVFLKVDPGELSNGIFKGNVAFTADGRTEPKVSELTLQASNGTIKWLGVAVIALGVVWAWLVNVYWKLEVMRLTALEMATSMREQFEELLKLVRHFERQTGSALHPLKQKLEMEAAALTPQALAGVLPSLEAFYRQFDDAALKAVLSHGSETLKVYIIIVRQGVDVLRMNWVNAAAPAKPGVATAAQGINVGNVADEAAAHALVDAAIAGAAGALGGGGGAAPVSAPLSSQEILVRIDGVNMRAWLTYTILVIISGAAVLILRNPGFGTWLDFIYCLFWGFGLPTTADKLQNVTASTVGNTLSVSMPK